jgi:hypothetical protein
MRSVSDLLGEIAYAMSTNTQEMYGNHMKKMLFFKTVVCFLPDVKDTHYFLEAIQRPEFTNLFKIKCGTIVFF